MIEGSIKLKPLLVMAEFIKNEVLALLRVMVLRKEVLEAAQAEAAAPE
jgi:hypothetical protein